MTVRNKDGSAYRLRRPNPLMVTQDRWDSGKLVLHNLRWHGVIIPDEELVRPFESAFNTPPTPSPQFADRYINEPEPTPEPVLPDPEPQAVAHKPAVPRLNKTKVHCLPAIVRRQTDGLYGDTYRTIQYNSPFTFEAVIVENEYARMVLWTTFAELTEGSVLFPVSEDRRWWRVAEIKTKTGGYLVSCLLSDYHPDFSRAQS